MTPPALRKRAEQQDQRCRDDSRPEDCHENGALDGGSKLGLTHVGDANGGAHLEIVGGSSGGGQVAAASPIRLATSRSTARKRAALRLLRLREASCLSQEALAVELGASKRAYGSIERAEARIVALEAFLLMFDLVIEEQGLDAALAAILTEEQRAGVLANQSAPLKRAA